MYGPVRTVVWQGSAGDRRPYADQCRLTGQSLPLLVGWLEVLTEGRQVHFAQ